MSDAIVNADDKFQDASGILHDALSTGDEPSCFKSKPSAR
jgi:hypothetical protein